MKNNYGILPAFNLALIDTIGNKISKLFPIAFYR